MVGYLGHVAQSNAILRSDGRVDALLHDLG